VVVSDARALSALRPANLAGQSSGAGPPALVAVLAGGRGTRIGGAKPSAPLGGRTLIEHVLVASREAELETVVLAKRATELPALAERVLVEPDEPSHPLCGVLAVLDFLADREPERAVLAVPCDMPFLSSALLRWLAELDGAAVLELDGAMQPLPARVVPANTPALREALERERSLRAALGALAPCHVDERELSRFGDPARLCFGVNSPEQLALAESWLSEPSLPR
jgi:molybdenum cofactor guanylyltransferase